MVRTLPATQLLRGPSRLTPATLPWSWGVLWSLWGSCLPSAGKGSQGHSEVERIRTSSHLEGTSHCVHSVQDFGLE